jgi:hypothetical protein
MSQQPSSPAQQFIETLRNVQMSLDADRPKDCKIISTAVLMSGEQIKIVSAYAADPNLIVFTAVRQKKTVMVVARYDTIMQCVFHFEKGERRPITFDLQPPPLGFSVGSRSESESKTS